MLRINGSDQYINQTQVDEIRPLLGQFWNSSISWTTSVNSSTSIRFVGTDIWAYGISGPEQGSFLATLDNHTLGTYSAYNDQGDTNYHHLLFTAHQLEDGPIHTLTLTNQGSSEGGEGDGLAFDYAVVQSSAYLDAPTTPTEATSTTTSSTPSIDPATAASASMAAASASALAAAEAMLPYHFTPAQLTSLTIPYEFSWNGTLYFVVVFSALIAITSLFFTLYALVDYLKSRNINLKDWATKLRSKRPQVGFEVGRDAQARGYEEGDGGSYLIHQGRRSERRTTRLLDALRGKKISSPVPISDNGSIATGGTLNPRRESDGSGFQSHGKEEEGDHTVGGW
ncbi:hypothetical protein CI109_102954 [Kwoniella shandongensis]|uniref:Uncharacterized protein n=1 Tax=Kwoniella shandongensis TaxID=1734106 RepID=A0AAJ8LIP3_9TREE